MRLIVRGPISARQPPYPGRLAAKAARALPPAALMALASGCPALAQTVPAQTVPAPVVTASAAAPGGLEEVVVTARHRAEKAQTVPIALTSVGGAKLDANGIVSVNQLAQLIPTLQVTEFNPRNTSQVP